MKKSYLEISILPVITVLKTLKFINKMSSNNETPNRKLSEEEKTTAMNALLEKRQATLDKFLTPAEQLKHGDYGVLVQIERGMESTNVQAWFQIAEQDLGQKCMYSAMKCNGKDENWCNGWLGSRWSDLTLNGRKVRVAFYERTEDPKAFAVYNDWKMSYSADGKCGRYAIKNPNRYIYLLVINPYYFDETENNWRPEVVRPQCCMCFRVCEDQYGNNARPCREGQCCNKCNVDYVIPARMTDGVVEEILRKNPDKKIKAGVREDAYKYASELFATENKTRMDHLRTKVCETLNIAVNSSPEEAQTAINLAKEEQKQRQEAEARAEWEADVKANRQKNAKERLRGTGSGPVWEAFKEAGKFLDNVDVIKKRKRAAEEAEAKLLRELDREPVVKKTEAKKQAKPVKKICSCGNKDCMPRPAKTAFVNGVKRDQTVLQNNWDKKHSGV